MKERRTKNQEKVPSLYTLLMEARGGLLSSDEQDPEPNLVPQTHRRKTRVIFDKEEIRAEFKRKQDLGHFNT